MIANLLVKVNLENVKLVSLLYGFFSLSFTILKTKMIIFSPPVCPHIGTKIILFSVLQQWIFAFD